MSRTAITHGLRLLLAVCWAAVPAAAEELTYERHIRPILKVHCLDCHGAAQKLKGGLDLRLRRFLVKGGESGAAITPGKPGASLLLERIRKGEMPPTEVKVPAESIATLERWIAAGARTARPEPETLDPGIGITLEDRKFWSFQPIRRAPVPAVDPADRARTPIDAFLLAAMAHSGLSFSPDADRRTLVRRAYLDLLGLPPTPEQVEAFLADGAPDAWERLIDRLLNSQHYGERWARHWLDIAGYADSEGDTDSDRVRPFAYKYRDYVIHSFNADKPFDEFLVEQLAGDELVTPPYTDLTPDAMDKLAATGFLRMAADPTVTGGDDAAKNQVVADTIKIVSTSLLGLSVGCAQCHDHRYDPISHTDYYRIRAVFEPALDWKNWRSSSARRVSLYSDEDRARAQAIEAEVSKVAAERAKKQSEYIDAALEKELETFPEEVRDSIRKAYKTPGGKRTAEQNALFDAYPSARITGGNLYQYNGKAAAELKKYNARMAKLREKKPSEDFLRVLTEIPGQVPETHRFHRGDHQQPREKVAPGGLTIAALVGERLEVPLNDAALPTTGRRTAYAHWLTNGQHPLVARVLVNRLWMHHFGQGIVSTPADFGKLGTKPTHPALLDWLADAFMRQGWSIKKFHRLVMMSTAYRQSSVRQPEKDAIDSENRFYWRKSVLRLDAESVRDRMLCSSGEIRLNMFGPPEPVQDHFTGQVIVKSPRRSIYVQVRRTKPVAMLKAFDAPVMQTNCDRRPSSTVAPQALLLMNSDFILERAGAFARRLRGEIAGQSDVAAKGSSVTTRRRRQLQRAWQLAYLRPACEDELQTVLAFVVEQVATLQAREQERQAQAKKLAEKKDSGGQKVKQEKKGKEPLAAELQALINVCQVLLSSSEFLYVD